jgi:hypothetical protein
MQLAQTADGIMDGKDALLGRFASQRLYVAHLTMGANGIVERFHRTALSEFYRVAFSTQDLRHYRRAATRS